jgi:hypothetical protein
LISSPDDAVAVDPRSLEVWFIGQSAEIAVAGISSPRSVTTKIADRVQQIFTTWLRLIV